MVVPKSVHSGNGLRIGVIVREIVPAVGESRRGAVVGCARDGERSGEADADVVTRFCEDVVVRPVETGGRGPP